MLPLQARVDLEARAIKVISHSPKLQHCRSLTIRMFSIISRSHVGCGQSVYSTAPADLAHYIWYSSIFTVILAWIPVRDPSIHQIELFPLLLYWKLFNCVKTWLILKRIISIRQQYLKPFNCVQTTNCNTWFGLVLWYIYPCGLFNYKSC